MFSLGFFLVVQHHLVFSLHHLAFSLNHVLGYAPLGCHSYSYRTRPALESFVVIIKLKQLCLIKQIMSMMWYKWWEWWMVLFCLMIVQSLSSKAAREETGLKSLILLFPIDFHWRAAGTGSQLPTSGPSIDILIKVSSLVLLSCGLIF